MSNIQDLINQIQQAATTSGNTVINIINITDTPVAEPAPAAAPAPVPAAAPANGEKVLSPFPGLIKNLLVAEGASVKKDEPILVLEAMKMDNDITAPCDGVVHFQVSKGANVESDSVLAVIS